ncbi:carboxymuconolactone decarboxylase family protein [Microbacterium sp. NPDC056044]|uniref:carboxymuconolactone decarboxylase family protein n=1 Tax=Microbacterium sp. NPDC056044 TaxID=3345690 RepID=UPI0035DD14DE
MDGPELLRRFCIGDPALAEDSGELWSRCLDHRTRDLVRIGALIAMSAPDVSLHTAIDDALSAGVAAEEIIAVMDGLVTVVGLPRAVAAAPRIASALGYTEDLQDDER